MAHQWITIQEDLKGLPIQRKCGNCEVEQSYERIGQPGNYEYKWMPNVGRCKMDIYINWRELTNYDEYRGGV